ncbi:MAG: 4'-phosphopantetheinyl transferase superfamily protein [Gammaproteobacteria bacterium]|nr:4'-phosphopantetheinyl transferase superfamily protein [Gammaproteobacteria bacterium]
MTGDRCFPVQYDTGTMIADFPIDERPLLSRLRHELHVWLLQPDRVTDEAMLTAYAASLSSEEQARQQRFYFERDRQLFLVAHGMLRRVLSQYVDVAPSHWQFSPGVHGRPEIAVPAGLPALRFNLSHTRGLVACVISLESDCGVDVERLRATRNPQAIANKMYAESELADLDKRAGADYLERFFSYWTLREAYCKATGLGIAHAPRNFAFQISSAGSVAIQFESPAVESADQWQFACLRPASEHLLAIAAHTGDAADKSVVAGYFPLSRHTPDNPPH